MVQEDILAEITVEPIRKIVGDPGQGDKNTLECEQVKKADKIKTTDERVQTWIPTSSIGQNKVWNSHLYSNGTMNNTRGPQRTMEDMRNQSKPEICHLIEVKRRKTCQKIHWVQEVFGGGGKY